MDIKNSEFLHQLAEAEMVLIGLGEEFNNVKRLRDNREYNECRQSLESTAEAWMIPALNMLYETQKEEITGSLQKLAKLLEGKNYFVVSVSTNDLIREIPWREKRLVMPCGGSSIKQCPNGCEKGLLQVTGEDRKAIAEYCADLLKEQKQQKSFALGCCPECGSSLVLNNIYNERYDENGYLEQWQLYTKWLQGTLNRRLLILELGVGMQCPSVIRWPFEKVAFFNQKASFWRVNETLYQLSEEIKGKGTSISQNAIAWLGDLC